MFYVYILQSEKSGKHYIGSTNDLERRLQEHNSGKNKSTRNKGPWKVVYTESYSGAREARQREYQIKSYKGGNSFRKLLESV